MLLLQMSSKIPTLEKRKVELGLVSASSLHHAPTRAHSLLERKKSHNAHSMSAALMTNAAGGGGPTGELSRNNSSTTTTSTRSGSSGNGGKSPLRVASSSSAASNISSHSLLLPVAEEDSSADSPLDPASKSNGNGYGLVATNGGSHAAVELTMTTDSLAGTSANSGTQDGKV